MTTPEAGWYRDEDASDLLRYWDGRAWTANTRPFPVVDAPTEVPARRGGADRTGRWSGPLPWLMLASAFVTVGALIVGVILAFAVGGSSAVLDGLTGDRDTASPSAGDPETRTVPETRIALVDIEPADDESEIEAVMGFTEGGDNSCSNDDARGVRSDPAIVDIAYRDAVAVQIGWSYSFCWGFGEPTEDTLIDPQGQARDMPLPPGSPIGTYTVRSEYRGQVLEAPVEVVPTEDERLYRDPASYPELGYTSEVSGDLELFLVGFSGDSIPVAVYEGAAFEGELVGVTHAEVDDDGNGRLVIGADRLDGERCVYVVADPQLSLEEWGHVEGVDGIGFGEEGVASLAINQQLAVHACFSGGRAGRWAGRAA